jgi:hypothetical protein
MKSRLFSGIASEQKLDIQTLTAPATVIELDDEQLSSIAGGEGGCRYDAKRHEEYCCTYDKNHHRHCYHRHRR